MILALNGEEHRCGYDGMNPVPDDGGATVMSRLHIRLR